MTELFIKDGPLMYPLLLCSIIAFAYALERTILVFLAGRKSDTAVTIHELLEKGETDRALKLATVTPGPVAAILKKGLTHAGSSKKQLEEVISLKGASEIKRLNQNLHIIELAGRISPLPGLLGTVTGLVEAFRTVSEATSGIDPSMLAGGIREDRDNRLRRKPAGKAAYRSHADDRYRLPAAALFPADLDPCKTGSASQTP